MSEVPFVSTSCFGLMGHGAPAPTTSPHGQTDSSKIDYVLAKNDFFSRQEPILYLDQGTCQVAEGRIRVQGEVPI